MSDSQRPAEDSKDGTPDERPTANSEVSEESSYPGDSSTFRLDGPEDPAGVEPGVNSPVGQTETAGDAGDTGESGEDAGGRRSTEREVTLDQARTDAP